MMCRNGKCERISFKMFHFFSAIYGPEEGRSCTRTCQYHYHNETLSGLYGPCLLSMFGKGFHYHFLFP